MQFDADWKIYERIQLILDAAPIAVNVFDMNTKLIDCNFQAHMMFGFEDKEEYLETFGGKFLLFSPKYQPCGASSKEKARMFFDQAKVDGRTTFSWVHLDAGGQEVPTDITIVRIKFRAAALLIAYLQDLRKALAAEEKVREANEINKAMIEASPYVISLWDKSSNNPTFVSEQAKEFFGIDDVSLITNNLLSISPEFQPCGTPTEIMAVEVVSKTYEVGYHCFEWLHHKKDGTLVPSECIFKHFVTSAGKDMLVSYTRDLTELKRAQEIERTVKERAQALLDSSPMVCGIFNEEYKIVEINQKAERLFGIANKQEFIDNSEAFFPKYQPDGTLSCEKCASLLKLAFERGSVRYEWYYKTSDGTPIPCEEILERIKIGDRDYLLVYIRDLREEKALLAELVDALNNEQAANRANKQFLTKMSHEIRTPLNAVLGIAEIQLQKSVNPPEMEEAFSRIHRSASMLRSLIDDILDLAKVEAEKMEIFSNAYELVSLIVDTVQLNLMNIGSKRIEFSLKVEDELPSSLIGDELRIKQILNNLLSNAFKYTLEGTVSLSFSMESAPEFDDVVMTICVSDSGRGMTDEQIDKLFDSGFKRFNVEDNRQIEGVGLGMSITHSLVKMMRGSISVKSKKGRGSSFTVKIPQKRQGNAVLGKEVVESLENLELTQRSLDKIAKLKNEPMPYGRVLVVDDVESNLYVIKGFLVLYKISVETVSSGYAAIEKVAAGEIYDIIFMDHMMPGMDGFETVRIIRDMGYGYPIVALTANAIKGASEMFLSKGFDGFISKPIDITLLNDHLLHYIKDKQSPEVIEAARLEGSEVEGLDDSMQNLVRSFLLDAEKAVKTLESLAQVQELNDDALKSIVIQAHAMKSALHNIGCKELSEEAYALEKMNPAATDMQIIKARTEQFLNGLQELVSELAQKIAPDEYSNCDAADDDPELLREKLTAIAQACDSFDYDAASNVLDELKKQCSKKIGELLRDIETYLISGGFEEAADLANKAVAELEWHTKVAKG